MATAIQAGVLIDGTGADPIRDAVVVIDEGVIMSIGVKAPRGATVIDATGLTVLPGLIDCHVHIGISTLGIEQRVLTPPSLVVARALLNAGATLRAGFTTVRDGGGAARGVKMAIDGGLFPGPRMRISVGALSQTGGHGDHFMPSGVRLRIEDPERPLTIVDGVDAVRRGTRELLRAGADQIKILTSGGVLSPSDEPAASGFSPEEIAAAVYEAHAAGKTLMAHAIATQGIKNAVRAGVESIEHGIFIDEEACLEMRERGTYLVPTLSAVPWILRLGEKDPTSMPEYARRKAPALVETHRRAFEMALSLGVPIAMGTDTGVGPHGTNAEELSLMVRYGMTPMQAIVAATRTAAACVRLADQIGTLEPGKRADLIGVRGDPLADIGVLAEPGRLELVMKDGTRAV